MSSKSYSSRDLPILSSFGLGSSTEPCDPAKAKALFLNFLIAPVTWFFFFYLMGFLGGTNIQSIVLIIFYTYTAVRSAFHSDGRIILIRYFYINSCMFLTRITVVGVTSLPNEDMHCNAHYDPEDLTQPTFAEAFKAVFSRGMPVACGDFIFSGHTACTFIGMLIFHYHDCFPHPTVTFFFWGCTILALVSIIGCRSHYTVNVILGIYFACFVTSWYLNRATGVTLEWGSRLIRWLEWQHITKGSRMYPKKNYLADSSLL
ncbi:hypothetical protein TrLO_g2481 [Triparma laevis f. longispina]|uniref:Sphingomyelin synthase-like domain-containing protein n=1 Tax=Triparma laevis f. longispina TaxID=1714387 RepID=A0A9W7FLT2_9STRA|nr:hypothetical protein TrLO_g2481 [Triparma laevis f. longispina]